MTMWLKARQFSSISKIRRGHRSASVLMDAKIRKNVLATNTIQHYLNLLMKHKFMIMEP